MQLPLSLGRQLYAAGSLANDVAGFRFQVACPLPGAALTRVVRLLVDHAEIPVGDLSLEFGDGRVLRAGDVSPERPAPIAPRQPAWLSARAGPLDARVHELALTLELTPFGRVEIHARDAVGGTPAPAEPMPAPPPAREAAPYTDRVPHDHDPALDYGAERVAERQRYVEAHTGVRPHHIAHYSFDPAITRGNIENFTGVAQIPLGFAGPLRINGEHAIGDFLIPLATTEGTLVASYGRGMKLLSLAGGVTVTVSGDHMQRAPAFVFDSAREARAFIDWVNAHVGDIRAAAEATSRVAKLQAVEPYLASRFAYLRLDFTTGDAAGQNMVGKATLAACQWIMANAPTVRHFLLDSYFATDKKVSHVNVLHGRGKRVIAEATVPRALLREMMHVEPETFRAYTAVTSLSAFMAGSSSNGLHAPNAIAAMFMATGQDVANVAEGASSMLHLEVTPAGDLYASLTLPSLIVGTHGGGTGLATQRECLEMLGCYGTGKVNKLAEIVGAVALAGELSLAAAVLTLEWVSAHEKMGRKR